MWLSKGEYVVLNGLNKYIGSFELHKETLFDYEEFSFGGISAIHALGFSEKFHFDFEDKITDNTVIICPMDKQDNIRPYILQHISKDLHLTVSDDIIIFNVALVDEITIEATHTENNQTVFSFA